MKTLPAFNIDKWMQEHGKYSKVKIHGSVIAAISLRELQQLGSDGAESPIDLDAPLTYGLAQGSLGLRKRIAELHSSPNVHLTEENVVITTGSILANYLTLTGICGSGDHVICQYPTYGQLYIVPRAMGAEVDMWGMRAENNWIPNVEELASMIKPNTKVIIINNPSNPTGTVLPESILKQIVNLAEKHNILLFSDEVFAPLFHGSDAPPPMITLGYQNTISTGSVSKAYGLAGLRVGWIVSPNLEMIERAMTSRDYTTISVSEIDQGIAAFALSPTVLPKLMKRNLAVAQRTISVLETFVKANPERCSWIRPAGAGTAFICFKDRNGQPVNDVKFAKSLLDKTGVSLIPGNFSFSQSGSDDFKGYVRIALGDEKELQQALPLLQQYLDEN